MVSENHRIKSAQPKDVNCGLEREVPAVGPRAVDAELEHLGRVGGQGWAVNGGRGGVMLALSASGGGIRSWPLSIGCSIC